MKISMIGSGSAFVVSVARELLTDKIFDGCEFCLMDVDRIRLRESRRVVAEILAQGRNRIHLSAVSDLEPALKGCDYAITSCEINRYEFWAMDLKIPARHGVHQVKGENGGPGGFAHALRNIRLFQNILGTMERICPDAWLLNFTNPMSVLSTYCNNYSQIKTLGFCHQVHGSFGVIAEQLGMEPGELQIVSGGINHLNWLFDIRRRDSGTSCMREFLDAVRKSKYWRKKLPLVPRQTFTLEVLETFGMYPIGFDDHIMEYLPFFYEKEEWERLGFKSHAATYAAIARKRKQRKGIESGGQTLLGADYQHPPFPKDEQHPYYAEKPCEVIVALERNRPTYLDAINIRNHGAIGNLPADAIVDIPAVVVGGAVRSVHVGDLPPGPLEICRRQVSLHEMIAQAAHEGDESLAVQALCLDPYVRSITQAKKIWADFKKYYAGYFPEFKPGSARVGRAK
jgi:alpha-galactosidase